MTTSDASPVTPTERIVTLDVLRAFALLGILVMNMPLFFASGWSPLMPEQRWPSGADRAAWWLMDTFFSGKFNSLFSFLFGIGFAIQLERLMARSAHPLRTYFRRLAVLFLFGVAHGVLLWMGDVLHMYAILGAVLVLLRRVPDRLILALIVVGLLAPTGFAVHELLTYTPADEQTDRRVIASIEGIVVAAHTQGSYADVVRSNIAEYVLIYSDPRGYYFFPSLFVTILIGFYMGRKQYVQRSLEHIRWWRRTAVLSFGFGLTFALTFSLARPFLVPFKPSMLGVVVSTAYSLQRPALMLFYAAAIVLLVHSQRWAPVLGQLAPAGRMPLTNYLLQSVICTTIFNGYGLGFFNRVGPAVGLGLSVVIYSLQVVWSQWWFARYEFGPMEWIWRALTYGSAPELVRRAAAAPVAPATKADAGGS